MGITYKEVEEFGILMPVAENYPKYIRPAKYDDLLLAKVNELPEMRMDFDYEIENEAGKLIHIGRTQLAFLNKETGKPCKTPEMMLNLLQPFYV